MIDLVRLLLGWGVVWLAGAGLLRRAYAGDTAARAHPAWIAGAGFLAGGLLLALEMALVSRAGIPFGLASVGLPFALAALALWWPELQDMRGWRARATHARGTQAARMRSRAATVGFALLLAWLLVHALLLLGEVVRRPLYPWDAWTHWGT
jgi:hypothetical protein